jgi:hypothetical protein
MQFRKWLIKEMVHISIDKPIDIKDKKNISLIDMQFELYPDRTQEDLEQVTKWIINGFAAKIPEGSKHSGSYLVFDGHANGGGTRIFPTSRNKEEVPEDWWERAYMSNAMPTWKSA